MEASNDGGSLWFKSEWQVFLLDHLLIVLSVSLDHTVAT